MFYNPVKVIETKNWIKECKFLLRIHNVKNPLIITTYGNFKRNNLDSIFDKKSIYHNIQPNPNFQSCQNAINFVSSNEFDGIVALGGGSVLDTAKVVLASIQSKVFDIKILLKNNNKIKEKVKSILIPTTHGTGSEVNMWGTVWDIRKKKKHSISNESLYPSYAILDPQLVLSLSLKESVITTLDSLSHSFESIWNKNANETSNKYAIEAINLIFNNISRLKNNPLDIRARKNLLLASNRAGYAFSNTKTAAAHSISYPLTLNFSIPHGIASSITLVPLLKINKDMINKSLQSIYSKIDCSFEGLIDKILDIPCGIIPFKLNDWGVEKKDISKLIEQSFTADRMKNNIVNLKKKDVSNILNEILE
jgi:phosphonate metabolism-associated iron-containing alcohol dehydrogenase